MEIVIVERDTTPIVGMVYYGDPFKSEAGWSQGNEIGRLWDRFNTYWDAHRDLFKHAREKYGYELHIGTDEVDETKEYSVMVGVEVSEIEDPPPPTFVKLLPAGLYAQFTLTGAEIRSNWSDEIHKNWLPASEYEQAYPYTIERYDGDRFRGPDDPTSELDILVPVRPKAIP